MLRAPVSLPSAQLGVSARLRPVGTDTATSFAVVEPGLRLAPRLMATPRSRDGRAAPAGRVRSDRLDAAEEGCARGGHR